MSSVNRTLANSQHVSKPLNIGGRDCILELDSSMTQIEPPRAASSCVSLLAGSGKTRAQIGRYAGFPPKSTISPFDRQGECADVCIV